MINRLRTLFERWRDAVTLDALTDRDLADLGFSREQVIRFAQMPADVPDRVVAMGAIFGLTEAELRRNRSAWTDLLETCDCCNNRSACRVALAKGDPSNLNAALFCPNRQAFMDQRKLS